MTLLFALMFVTMTFASDLFNVGTIYKYVENVPATGNVNVLYEDYSHVIYQWRFTFVDSSDAYHSKPLYVGNCNLTDGYVNAVQSAAGDANIIYHYSADNRTVWLTTTPNDLDALSNTAVQDTIGIEEAVNDIKFHFSRWLVVEAVGGGTTNADDNILTITIKLKKFLTNAVYNNGDYIRQGDITMRNSTNP